MCCAPDWIALFRRSGIQASPMWHLQQDTACLQPAQCQTESPGSVLSCLVRLGMHVLGLAACACASGWCTFSRWPLCQGWYSKVIPRPDYLLDSLVLCQKSGASLLWLVSLLMWPRASYQRLSCTRGLHQSTYQHLACCCCCRCSSSNRPCC